MEVIIHKDDAYSMDTYMESDGIGVLDHGKVSLIAESADDLDVVNAARVSLHAESYEMSEGDAGLIRYLMRERHGTPFEHGFFKFRIKAPLFVFREWHRHRVGHSYNEWSARYSQLDPVFYIPKVEDVVTQQGKPGNYEFAQHYDNKVSNKYIESLQHMSALAYNEYKKALANGIAKQQARLFLPVNIYSEMIWSCNPRSLMHFCSLRNSNNAQAEIREYAQVVEGFFLATMPITATAFIDSGRVAP